MKYLSHNSRELKQFYFNGQYLTNYYKNLCQYKNTVNKSLIINLIKFFTNGTQFIHQENLQQEKFLLSIEQQE